MIFAETVEDVRRLIYEINIWDGKPLFCDLESTGLDWFVDDILLFQIKVGEEIFVVDIRGLGYSYLKEILQVIVATNSVAVFHNTKFDLKFLYHRTGVLLLNVYDTMTTEAVLNSGVGKTFYSLEELAEKYAGIFMDKSIRKEFINYPKDMPFTESQLNYSAMDVKALEDIYTNQIWQFEQTRQCKVKQLESNLLPIVAKMEYDGVRMDSASWLEVEKEAIKERDRLVQEFDETILDFILSLGAANGYELAQKVSIPVKTKRLQRQLEEITDLQNLRGWIKENFNVKSPKQLFTILTLMKIKVKSTNAKIIEEFLDAEKAKHPDKQYPVLEKLLRIRKVNKQIDQYGSNFLKSIHPLTGKIHTEYFTVGTQTGRFSSNNPNLQNVPRTGGYRECFLPDEGYVFVSVDYSQQEYRLAGAVSKEPVIIQAYVSGSDMHTATGKIVAKKDTITKEERVRGKTVNFAVLYGSTEYGLRRNLRIEIEEAKRILRDFWNGYKNLSGFMEKAGEKILELGYSVTPLGRRRYNVPKPLYGNSYEYIKWQERVLREGRNHIIQGGGADIMKLAIVEIFKRNPFGEKLKLCLQIHDEIVAQVHKSIQHEALEFIKEVMKEVEQPFLGEIPAEVDGEIKERWSK